ncbi:MAG: hypothetical protein Q8P67_09830, partial [archaeon]|nr:hypothetical protein [archaeon]
MAATSEEGDGRSRKRGEQPEEGPMPGKGCKRAKTTEWDTYNPNRLSPSLFCDENMERWVNQPEQTEMFFHLRKGLLLLLRPALKRYIDRRHLELSSWPSLFSSVLRLLVRLPAMTEQAALQAFEDADAYHQVWRLAGPSVKKLILRDAYTPHLGEDSWNAKASFSPPVYEAEKAYHKLHQKSWMASDSSSSSSSTSASSELTCSNSTP